MSGRKISDHSSFCGKGSGGSVLPLGCKMKQESSSVGAGAIGKYEDSTEAIKGQQMNGASKMRAHGHNNAVRF